MRSMLMSLVAVGCMVMASCAQAQSFQVKLGNKALGTLTYSRTAKVQKLSSTLNNTPLGVFDGTFKASSRRVPVTSGTPAQKYDSISTSSRKTRQISMLIKAGRAIETNVAPSSEETPLSDPVTVPHGVIDPVDVIGRLINTRGCPKKLTIYDGRRAITLSPKSKTKNGNVLDCAIRYQVVAGPGHLSPLYISKVKMQVQYDLSGGKQKLIRMKLGSGLFNLILTRQN